MTFVARDQREHHAWPSLQCQNRESGLQIPAFPGNLGTSGQLDEEHDDPFMGHGDELSLLFKSIIRILSIACGIALWLDLVVRITLFPKDKETVVDVSRSLESRPKPRKQATCQEELITEYLYMRAECFVCYRSLHL